MSQVPKSIPLPEDGSEKSDDRNHNPYIIAAILALSIVVLLFYRLSGSQLGPAEPPIMVGVPKNPHSNQIIIDISGAVKRPGPYRMRKDSRVFDAVASAGGFTANADRNRVNLAARLRDEMKVVIPAVGEELPPEASMTPEPTDTPLDDGGMDSPPPDLEEPGPGEELPPDLTPAPETTPSAATTAAPLPEITPLSPVTSSPTPAATAAPLATSTPPPAPTVKVSINRAQVDELEKLPGIGPKVAQEIVNYRKGPPPHAFTSLEELSSLPSLKDRKLEEILPYLKL